MKNILEKLSRNKPVIFSLIFVIATIFYLFNLGFSDLWSDEIYTKSMLDGSLPDFFAKFKNDLHPPLYYLGILCPLTLSHLLNPVASVPIAIGKFRLPGQHLWVGGLTRRFLARPNDRSTEIKQKTSSSFGRAGFLLVT